MPSYLHEASYSSRSLESDAMVRADYALMTTTRLPLLSARPAVTLATLKRAATDFAAW